MSDKDRIRLAEAMGWSRISMKYIAMEDKSYPFGCPPADQYSDGVVNKRIKEQIPDPFTDANDDYAVLEWARENLQSGDWYTFCDELWNQFQAAQGTTVDQGRTLGHYRVGFYARAYLKVLDND